MNTNSQHTERNRQTSAEYSVEPQAWIGTTAQSKQVSFTRAYTPTVAEVRTRLAGTAEIKDKPGDSIYCIDVSTLLQEIDTLTIKLANAARERSTYKDAIEGIAYAFKEANINIQRQG